MTSWIAFFGPPLAFIGLFPTVTCTRSNQFCIQLTKALHGKARIQIEWSWRREREKKRFTTLFSATQAFVSLVWRVSRTLGSLYAPTPSPEFKPTYKDCLGHNGGFQSRHPSRVTQERTYIVTTRTPIKSRPLSTNRNYQRVMPSIIDNALGAVGHTPLIRLDKIAKAKGLKCNLCEFV